MRSLLLLPLLPAIALAEPVVALLPPHGGSPELTRLGLLIEARAAELVEANGKYRELHVKQVLLMAEQEGLDPARLSEDETADRARKLLGADRVVSVRIATSGDGLVVEGSVRSSAAPAPFSVSVPSAWSKAVVLGSEAIAKAVMAPEKVELPEGASAQPESSSDAALKSLAVCWEIALTQSMSVEAPVTIEAKELEAATAACRAAVKADPKLDFASAVLALLLAIEKDDGAATKLLDGLRSADALEPWTLARFWILARTQSVDAAAAFLEGMIEKHPGELLLRSYYAESLSSSNQPAKAVGAWNEYLSVAPNSTYAYGRLSRSLSKLEKVDAGLKAAALGLARAPESREARLQLASRQIDAGKPAEAVKTLAPFATLPDAPAEGLLRLGWAHWLLNDKAAAVPLFKAAAERAKGPTAWRTKGRALYNLAVAEVKAGHLDAAKSLYQRSVETGFAVTTPDPALASVGAKSSAKGRAGGPYVYLHLMEDKDGPVTPAQLAQAVKLARETITGLGAALAPDNEDRKTALSVLKAQKRRGFQVNLHLVPGDGEGSLKVDALVMTYPEKGVRGAWDMKASGGAPEELISAMVPKLFENIAGDLEW